MSPVVLLLKLAEEKGVIASVRGQKMDRHGWGRVAPYRDYLRGLKFTSLPGPDGQYWPGLPSCILSLVPIWTSHETVISASNDRFPATKSLEDTGRIFRREQLSALHQSCTKAVFERIQELEEASKRFKRGWKTKKQKSRTCENSTTAEEEYYMTEDDYNLLVRRCEVVPVHLPGILATWSPCGEYMPPCLLDYWRFRTLRPPRAEIMDQRHWSLNEHKERVMKKRVWATDSCAEWAAFLQLASVKNSEVSVIEPRWW